MRALGSLSPGMLAVGMTNWIGKLGIALAFGFMMMALL